ncbi:hypothetical protein [Flavobacterium polysaccharolyticum]|uniref:CarboxypepD_reg-like domain-containing protein n=1 Tax=Flavobacterium polysaccharolyticum TaxID=3133148 RepID=A0ABU9NR97_9FLAO
MKGNYSLVLFFFFTFGVAFSQERSNLKGKVTNSMGAILNGSVVNLSSKTRTAISEQGYFEILAQPKDTLLFASLACLPKKVILNSKNFDIPFLEIELQLFDNELKEVIVLNQKKIRPLNPDLQKYIDKKYFDDMQSSPTNPLMPPTTIANGTDFVRLFKDVKKLFKKKALQKEREEKPINYYVEVINSVPTDFFFKNFTTQRRRNHFISFFLRSR